MCLVKSLAMTNLQRITERLSLILIFFLFHFAKWAKMFMFSLDLDKIKEP